MSLLPAGALERSPSFSCSFSRPSLLPSPDCPPCSHTQAPLGPYRVLFSPRYQLRLGWDGVQGTWEPCCAVVCVVILVLVRASHPGGDGAVQPHGQRGLGAPILPEGPQPDPQPRQWPGLVGHQGAAVVRFHGSLFLRAWGASGQRGGLCGVVNVGPSVLQEAPERNGPFPLILPRAGLPQPCDPGVSSSRAPSHRCRSPWAEGVGSQAPAGGRVQGPLGSSAWARALQLCHILFSPFRLQTQSR